MKTFFLEPISLKDGSGKRMLAFQRNGITYNRIQIDTPPGLTGRIVDNNIRSLSSKEKFDQELSQKVEAQKSNDKFKARFPAGRAAIQGQVTPEKVARECAKVDLLRKNGEGTYGTRRGEDYCKNPTQGMRGFRDRDLEAITRMVCGAMK
jgi:hypothetical protein